MLQTPQCSFQIHPEANTQKQPDGNPTPWSLSAIGKRYAAANKPSLSWGYDINNSVVSMETDTGTDQQSANSTITDSSKSKGYQGKNYDPTRNRGGRGGRGKLPPVVRVRTQQLLSSMDNIDDIPITLQTSNVGQNLQRGRGRGRGGRTG